MSRDHTSSNPFLDSTYGHGYPVDFHFKAMLDLFGRRAVQPKGTTMALLHNSPEGGGGGLEYKKGGGARRLAWGCKLQILV